MIEYDSEFGFELNRAILEKDPNLIVRMIADYLSANKLSADKDIVALIPIDEVHK